MSRADVGIDQETHGSSPRRPTLRC
jgi:hypothetical protein